jgi:hypothetical protein
MGGGRSSSSADATDRRVTLTDDARAASEGSTLVESGSVNVSDGSALNTGTQIDSAGSVTIEGGTEALLSINRAWLDELNNLASGTADTVSGLASSQQSVLQDVLSAIRPLAESSQTDGDNAKERYLLWAGGGALLLGAIYLLKK